VNIVWIKCSVFTLDIVINLSYVKVKEPTIWIYVTKTGNIGFMDIAWTKIIGVTLSSIIGPTL